MNTEILNLENNLENRKNKASRVPKKRKPQSLNVDACATSLSWVDSVVEMKTGQDD